jgi:hypothetical protein
VIHKYRKINGVPASLDRYIIYVSMAISRKAVVILKVIVFFIDELKPKSATKAKTNEPKQVYKT